MATKVYCDCCGIQFEPRSLMNKVRIPCHVTSTDKLKMFGYQDSEGNLVSGRMDDFDVCNSCSNAIYGSMDDMLRSIKKAKEEQSTEFTSADQRRTTQYVKEYKSLLKRLRELYYNLPILQEKMENDCVGVLHDEKQKPSKSIDELAKTIINQILRP